ncbi:hypothetical protein [Phenylobacterium aquaticum]|uniref:hypothetical protein n=1 Tax=Phenylobacterium aquaticum TaxID=1763816 RepID=UPI001F5CD86D|nr:hypothetical protein [Phenylobacterium aquaticum]MCI3131755.1 hypothetical protein [Phenylobacterium aquaticum]
MKTLAALSLAAVATVAASHAWALPSRSGAVAGHQGLTLFAPEVAQNAAGARVEGAVCRLGPVPSVKLGELSVEHVGPDGQTLAVEPARVAPVLRDRGARCAYYHVQTAWVVQPSESVQVCMSSPAGGAPACVRRPN